MASVRLEEQATSITATTVTNPHRVQPFGIIASHYSNASPRLTGSW